MTQNKLYRDAVGIVLTNATGHIFIGKRTDFANNPQFCWQMPQGGIDPHETPHQAALRELTEETGCAAHTVRVLCETKEWYTYDLPDALLKKVKRIYKGQRQKWFQMQLLEDDRVVNLMASSHQEFIEWRWATAAEVVQRIVPFKRAVYEAVLKDFGYTF